MGFRAGLHFLDKRNVSCLRWRLVVVKLLGVYKGGELRDRPDGWERLWKVPAGVSYVIRIYNLICISKFA